MKKKILAIPSKDIETRKINPEVVVDIESKLALLNKYEKELTRPLVLLTTAGIFYGIFYYSTPIIADLNRSSAESLHNYLAELGYNFSETMLRYSLHGGVGINFAFLYYLLYTNISHCFNYWTSLTDWISRKCLGERPVINLDSITEDQAKIVSTLQNQIAFVQKLQEAKMILIEKAIFPALLLRKIWVRDFYSFYGYTPFENFLALLFLPDGIISGGKAIMQSLKGKHRIKTQLDELISDYTSATWTKYMAGFFLLKILPPNTKRKSDLLKPQHFLSILKNIFIAHDSALVITQQSNAMVIMVSQFFSNEEMEEFKSKIKKQVNEKLLEHRTLNKLNNLNKILKIDLDWYVHYCKSQSHPNRFQLALETICSDKKTEFIYELSLLFPSADLKLNRDLIDITYRNSEININYPRLLKKIQQRNQISSKQSINAEDKNSSKLTNGTNLEMEADEEVKLGKSKKDEKNSSSIVSSTKPLLPQFNLHIFWGKNHQYHSDKKTGITELLGCYVKKGSYFGYFNWRVLKKFLNDQQLKHYNKIATDGNVVPRRKKQGIVACKEYVKGPDKKWHLSLFKLKDPTTVIRIHGIETIPNVKVNGINRHLIEFNTIKVK